MPEHYTYLAVDFFCIIFPLIFSFFPQFHFFSQWKYFVLPCLLTAVFFIVWDIAFTWYGVWGFSPQYVLGYFYFGLPIEEYLFFICIPYACTFTYYCIRQYLSFTAARRTEIVKWAFVTVLVVVALLHLHQLYTSVTFLLLAGYLTFLSYKKVTYLPAFFFCFLIILVPFFISNGILTGSFVQRVVVMYSRHHILGIHMYTIPVEDTFYGMLLLLMNVSGYEYLKDKAAAKENQPVTVGK